MARNNRFYKRTLLSRIKILIQKLLTAFALIVLLYYYYVGTLLNAITLYLVEFPLQIVKDICLLINVFIKGT